MTYMGYDPYLVNAIIVGRLFRQSSKGGWITSGGGDMWNYVQQIERQTDQQRQTQRQRQARRLQRRGLGHFSRFRYFLKTHTSTYSGVNLFTPLTFKTPKRTLELGETSLLFYYCFSIGCFLSVGINWLLVKRWAVFERQFCKASSFNSAIEIDFCIRLVYRIPLQLL